MEFKVETKPLKESKNEMTLRGVVGRINMPVIVIGILVSILIVAQVILYLNAESRIAFKTCQSFPQGAYVASEYSFVAEKVPLNERPQLCMLDDKDNSSPHSDRGLLSQNIYLHRDEHRKFGIHIQAIIAHELGHLAHQDSYLLWRQNKFIGNMSGKLMEYEADAFAARLIGKDKVIAYLVFDGDHKDGGITHPPHKDRIEALNGIRKY